MSAEKALGELQRSSSGAFGFFVLDTEERMSGVVEDVKDDNYDEWTQAAAAVVVYGIATCDPCNAFDPILAEMAQRYSDVRFGKAKMHVPGRCRAIKKQYQFETYPTTHFFSNGNLLLTREGKIEPEELAKLIDQHFLNH